VRARVARIISDIDTSQLSDIARVDLAASDLQIKNGLDRLAGVLR
jgi:hypothetical protein